MNVIEKNITLADGRVITLETGKLAKQADGAVMLKMGNTMLLATVVSAQDAGPDVDFMPLSVDYKEKFASVGRFPGGFTRREGKSSDYEILVSRLVDRALRPRYPFPWSDLRGTGCPYPGRICDQSDGFRFERGRSGYHGRSYL